MNIHQQDCQLQAASDSVSCEQFALGQNLQYTDSTFTHKIYLYYLFGLMQ